MNEVELNQRIQNFSDKQCGMGATPERVKEVEALLAVAFPKSYRSYLQHFGWARFSHEELYGLGADAPNHLDLVRNTIAERTIMRPKLPHALIPIMNDGAGNHYCLDTRYTADEECPIILWDHEADENQNPQIMAQTFTIWLSELLDELTNR